MNRLLVFLAAAALVTACGAAAPVTVAPGEGDKLLLERGGTALKDRKWITAREYYSELLESYPQSPLRADAKLGVGDTYIGENNSASYVYALNEYREFLAFYPTHSRADYAQYQLGMVHLNQMLGPQRDQTETKEAIREFQTFVDRFPNSPMIGQARQRLREARDRLGDSELQVGVFYLNIRAYSSAIDRLRGLLKSDPEYTRKDALYFHLADALEKSATKDSKAEALPYFERLVQEFEQSEFLERAKERIAVLKAGAGL
jgi:outer membrane protein assembly factor BamD